MSLPPPAAPRHLLRLHSHPINTLSFSADNERLHSGDTSGLVVSTSTRNLRVITKWQAHSGSILGIEELGDEVITHGRDNKLHAWKCAVELPESAKLGDAAARLSLPAPQLSYSLDVNALNYCRFSLLRLKAHDTEEARALVALPGLVDSSVVDIWSLPSRNRIHAAIGQEISKSIFSADPKGRNNAGILMSLHLYASPIQSAEIRHNELHLLCAYENGSVALRKYTRADKPTSVEGAGWEVIWTTKLHAETVMAMRVSYQNNFAISVSADNLVCRYDLEATGASDTETACITHKTKHSGNSSIAIRQDGKVCAIGGWDGTIRLYSTRTMKPLGNLRYHKATCQALEFAKSPADTGQHSPSDTESDDEMTFEEKSERERWLVSGGKDYRVSIWSLISFSK